ncbi:MAG TPA: sodium/proton-translocating pyrophosphatase [Fimbriimonadales bacterium]|nr:sodium/proton-translocating pyrophosphatase [Fimbriimonadales bacterium]
MHTFLSKKRNRVVWNGLLARIVVCFLLLSPVYAFGIGAEAGLELKFQQSDYIFLWISLGLSLLAILTGWGIARWVLRQDPGPEKMQEVSEAIRAGALGYLKRQIKTMLFFIVVLAVGLYFLYSTNPDYAGQTILRLPMALWLAIAFVLGVFASYIAGYTGMIMAVRANARTANAALSSYKRSLELALRAGGVAGLITVGMGLLGATLIFLIAGEQAMKLLIGFGFGGSLAALFMRVGGGIYTKAADVGADLVGKVEAGIPEDDPRNAATIADNVGDNVGDCAGMAADVFESYEVTLVAAIVLGAATAAIFDQATWMKLILFALMARGVGIVASILGILFVRGKDDERMDPLTPLRRGFWGSAFIAAAGTFVLAFMMMQNVNVNYYVDHTGARYNGIKKIDPLYGLALAVIGELEQAETMTPPGQPPPPGPRVASMSDKELTDKINSNIQNEYEQRIRMLPKDAPKPPAPPKVTEEQVKLARKDPLLNYTIVSGSNAVGRLGIGIGRFLAEEPRLAYVEIPAAQFPNAPPQQPRRIWQPYSKEQLEQFKKTGSIKILNEYPFGAGVDRKGDLYWIIEKPIKEGEKDALLALPPVSYTREKVQIGTFGSPTLAMAEGQIRTVEAKSTPVQWWQFSLALLFGILMAYLIELLTDYFVSFEKRPVRDVAASSTAGPAPMIIQGFAYGMESSVWAVGAIVICLLAPLFIFPPTMYGGPLLSFYGIALVGLGLLTTTGYILAMDTFGPISDNAQGVYEMSGAKHLEKPQEGSLAGSKAVQRLDAAGNTTKALTKGFAIATAVVAAVALFHSFIEDAKLSTSGLRLEVPEIFIGLLVGGAAPYLFSSFSINAVGRAGFQLINEVRRQFQADPGILAGTSKPDYERCVTIVTQAAQKELLGPGILAIALPALVAFGLSIGQEPVKIGDSFYNIVGAQALGGFLAGAILSGQLLAVMLANAGGNWDNAKKTIEDGLYGGKGSDAHKAGVVCDTVGDPFKDTAGPALNPLIKVMNLVALLMAPVVIRPLPNWVLITVAGIAIVLLGIAVFWSKRGSIGTELVKAKAGEIQEVPATTNPHGDSH